MMFEQTVPAEWSQRLQRLIERASAAASVLPPPDCAVLAIASDGLTNCNLIVGEAGDLHRQRRWILRLGTSRARDLAIDRRLEAQIWRAAAAAGLAAPPLAFDPLSGDALTAFIEAPSWADRLSSGRDDANRQLALLDRLAMALRKVHRLVIADAPVIGIGQRVDGLRQLGARHGWQWPDWLDDACRRCTAALASPAAVALTHGDVNPWNVLQTDDGSPVLLDWEYAAYADPLFDVATVLGHWPLTEAARAHWLAACGVGDADRARLAGNESLFHLREFVWAGAMQALGQRGADIDAQYWREAIWLQAHAL